MTTENELLNALGQALRSLRLRRDLSILELSDRVSGRTYLSALERGEKQPTLAKLEEIAQALEVHPLSLLVLAYQNREGVDVSELLSEVKKDLTITGLWDSLDPQLDEVLSR